MNISRSRGIRPGSLLLTVIFTVSALALMWTAVNCFKRINENYESASEGMAASQFVANKLRSAEGKIEFYADESGTLEKIVISCGEYDNIISFSPFSLREALVRSGTVSSGDELFSPESVSVRVCDTAEGLLAVTAVCRNGKAFISYVSSTAEMEFHISEKEAQS